MDERLDMTINHYAAMVLEWLDIDSKQNKIQRAHLVEKLVDNIWALEQIREQED